MSDKELALDSIQRLPPDAKLDAIAERLDFLAALRKGLDEIDRGETVPHEEVKTAIAQHGFQNNLVAPSRFDDLRDIVSYICRAQSSGLRSPLDSGSYLRWIYWLNFPIWGELCQKHTTKSIFVKLLRRLTGLSIGYCQTNK